MIAGENQVYMNAFQENSSHIKVTIQMHAISKDGGLARLKKQDELVHISISFHSCTLVT